MKKIIVLLASIYLTSTAQVPNMLKDITPGSASTKFGEFSLLSNNDMLFSVITPSSSSSGVWVSDGSTQGTKMLKPYPGYSFINYSGTRYFGVKNVSGYSLWRSNGTVPGTDSILTPGIKTAVELNVVNNTLVFVATNNSNSLELWRSDGTNAGTYSLTASASSIRTFTVYNNLLYFSLTNTVTGTELWRTDGTFAGTFMLRDIWVGAGSSFTNNPIRAHFSNTLFLQVNDGVMGTELWKTDGTTAGTSLVKDILPGSGSSSFMGYFFTGNNGIYFHANNQVNGMELWFSDGATANTNMIKDMNPGAGWAYVGHVNFIGNFAYYQYGSILYKSDGTSAGTTTLSAISGIPSHTNFVTNSVAVRTFSLQKHNNELYYFGEKINSNGLTSVFDSLFFFKADANLNSKTLLAKFSSPSTQSNGEFDYRYINSKMYFEILQDNSLQTSASISLFIYNPANGQFKVHHNLAYSSSSGLNKFRQFGNKLYYTRIFQDNEPSYIDLSNDSIYTLKNINPSGTSYVCNLGSAGSSYLEFGIFKLNNKGYFLANEPGYGIEFFETDFTPAGTSRVKDIYSGSNDFNSGHTTGANNCAISPVIYETPNNIFFCANDGGNGYELWSFINSPNNPGGGVSVKDINTEAGRVELYPNPTSGKLLVNSGEDKINRLIVLNALGAVVKEVILTENSFSAELDLSSVSAGVYFVKVNTAKGEVTKKLVKQ